MSEAVLVVGAGPTGLATAVHLALHDVPVRVIDAAPEPATTSRALGLQPRGAEVLERLGALGDLREHSRSLLNMYYEEGGRTVLRLQVGEVAKVLAKPTLLVSQAEVENVLRARFQQLGGKIEWSTRLVGATQYGDRVVVDVEAAGGHPDELTTSWLVGCDGAHSAVRKAAGIGFPGRKLIERLLMVDVQASSWPYDRDGSVTWMEAGRMLSVTALPDDVWRVFTEPPPGLQEALTPEEITDLVLGEFSRRTGMDPTSVDEVRWASDFRIHRRLADRYRLGRILLAGDAAHIQSPTGGQGQNTGLGDAENLAWKLSLVALGRADPRLLDTYEGERRPLARSVLGATSTAVDIMLPDRRWKRMIRDHLVLPAMRLRAVQRRVWLAASQLGVSYRGGPLAARSFRPRVRPRPGERVPDLQCLTAEGVQGTVHEAVKGRWVVLAGSHDVAREHAEAAARHLGEQLVTTVRPTRGRWRDVVLMRPDGHVAWRGPPDPVRMSAWLEGNLWPR